MSEILRHPPTEETLRARWLERRGTGLRMGLQAKLILSFLGLVALALGSSSWLTASQSAEQIGLIMNDQAKLMAYTLSLASVPAMEHANKAELEHIGADLLTTRNLLYVAFVDLNGKPIALTNRYADFSWKDVRAISANAPPSDAPQSRNSELFGNYIDVSSPVIEKAVNKPGQKKPAVDRTLGYVLVGVSLQQEQAQLDWVNWMMLDIGLAVLLVSVPLSFGLVYGIFTPIRQLVSATRKMASGRLDVTLEIHRDDLIGELAHSFDEMVDQVGKQREDLATTNNMLAEANSKLAISNEQLGRVNEDLEFKVQQRTSQLELANTRLSAEVSEKEDFLRAVSHDLNAPLRNIAGMSMMLLAKNKDKFDLDIVHRLERIQKNVQVGTELVSELLELSRIKSRRQRMEMVDTEAIVKDLSDIFDNDLRTKQIQLIMDTALPPLTAERARIRQVLQNLIDNAIKYMGDQPTRNIHIGCSVRETEAEFYVRDTGTGIAADDVSKVFHIFRRGRSVGVLNIPGKGVGLTAIKSIIETYHGRIWVESKLGEGSTFRFTLDGKHVSGCQNWLAPEAIEVKSEDDEEEAPAADRQAA